MAIVAAAAVACAVVAPFAAPQGLSAVIRTEIVRVSPAGPAPAAKNPDGSPTMAGMAGQFGDMFAKMMLPEGKVDMRWMAQSGASRSELRNPMLMMPAGTVLITRKTNIAVLNPAEHTYYEMPTGAGRTPGIPQGANAPQPEVTVTPTGKADTLLGHRVERVDVTMRMPLPARAGGATPAAAPPMTMSMEMWETLDFGDAVDPAQLASFQGWLATAGMDKIARAGRFPMKTITRMSMMPGYEIRSTVLEIARKPLAGDLFEVPAGFKKIDPPRPRLP